MSWTSIIIVAWATLVLLMSFLAKGRVVRNVLLVALVASSLGYALHLCGIGRRLIAEHVVGGDLGRPYAKGVVDLAEGYSPYVFGLAANTLVLCILVFVLYRRS
jgi:hypothetical protein